MNLAISQSLRSTKKVRVSERLRQEIAHWLFLKHWDSPLSWREERHFQIKLSTDASQSGWGGVLMSPKLETSDYWTMEEERLDIACKEALALDKVLRVFQDHVRDKRVDAMVDNQTVIYAWNNQGSRSRVLNDILKRLFSTTVELNDLLRLDYVSTHDNVADSPSRRLSVGDVTLSHRVWDMVEEAFGGSQGHTCDLMALDSNVMRDRCGVSLPHFTPHASTESLGVNMFAQDLSWHRHVMQRPYVFPPEILVILLHTKVVPAIDQTWLAEQEEI
ncbi:hypothetical protein AC249_AIPGENE8520 [Exaiptasia diaphana]|nr:hypothetical protein AC249_AIPGENE8520 [Exaiptasia diaphana]